VGPRAGLDDMVKRKFLTLPGLELRPLGRPALNQSLYPLRYPSSQSSRQYSMNVNPGTHIMGSTGYGCLRTGSFEEYSELIRKK
jgi:hypothetical protein